MSQYSLHRTAVLYPTGLCLAVSLLALLTLVRVKQQDKLLLDQPTMRPRIVPLGRVSRVLTVEHLLVLGMGNFSFRGFYLAKLTSVVTVPFLD